MVEYQTTTKDSQQSEKSDTFYLMLNPSTGQLQEVSEDQITEFRNVSKKKKLSPSEEARLASSVIEGKASTFTGSSFTTVKEKKPIWPGVTATPQKKPTFIDYMATQLIEPDPTMKYTSAIRRYYDTRDKIEEKKTLLLEDEKSLYTPPEEILNEEKEEYYLEDEKKKPSYLKMLQFNDMKRMYDKKVTREFLFKYGFDMLEINWLEDEGLIGRKTKY